MAGNPGLEALLECNEQVIVDIRNHLNDVANYLRKKEIIDLQLFTTVTDVTSRDSEYTRARMVFKRLQDMVQGNETYYVMFMEYLRSNPQKFGKSISMLDKAYVNKGRILPAGDNPGAARNTHVEQPPAIQAVSDVWTKKVQMFALNIIKYYDTNNGKVVLRLLDEMAPHWQVVSEMIGFTAAEIAAVRQPGAGKTDRQRIHEIITKWMRNAPGMPRKNRYPNTWQGILNMLEDSSITTIAEQLRTAVNATYSDFHDNYEDAPAEGVIGQQKLPAPHQPVAAPVGGAEIQPQMPAQQQQEPKPPAAQGKRRKMNKDALAKWLEDEGVEEDDVATLRDEGVNENLFLDIEENDEYGKKLSKATLKQLPKLKGKLTKK